MILQYQYEDSLIFRLVSIDNSLDVSEAGRAQNDSHDDSSQHADDGTEISSIGIETIASNS